MLGPLHDWCDQLHHIYFNLFRAPHGCDNYVTGMSGIVKNLGFPTGRPTQTHHYTYCVRRELGKA